MPDCARYIHLNPVKAGLVRSAEDWEYSSYRDFVGLRDGKVPGPGIVLAQFASSAEYRRFVESYREGQEESIAGLVLD